MAGLVYLIRHAESMVNNKPDIIGGRSVDTLLSVKGFLQAHTLGLRFKKEGLVFNGFFSSPTVRTKETARISLSHLGISLDRIVVCPEFHELSQGDIEGEKRAVAYTADIKAAIEAANGDWKPPNGESPNEVASRVLAKLVEITRYCECAAVYTHGVAIKATVGRIIKAGWNQMFSTPLFNTAITRVKYDGGWVLENYNDHAHLTAVGRLDQ